MVAAEKPVLSNRHRRLGVLMMLASGHSSKEMAALIDSTKATIDNDVAWWETRLGARSRAHIAAIALAAGILRADDVWFDGRRSSLDAFLARRAADVDALMERVKYAITAFDPRPHDQRN